MYMRANQALQPAAASAAERHAAMAMAALKTIKVTQL
jgi:hypothetical protein